MIYLPEPEEGTLPPEQGDKEIPSEEKEPSDIDI